MLKFTIPLLCLALCGGPALAQEATAAGSDATADGPVVAPSEEEARPAPPPPPPRPRVRAVRDAEDPKRLALPAPPPEPNAADTRGNDDATTFALGLSTSGFASGNLSGGFFVGLRHGPLIAGASFALWNLSTAIGSQDHGHSSWSLLGGLRVRVLSAADRKVDVFLQLDVGPMYRSESAVTFREDGSAVRVSYDSTALAVMGGPGIRYWLTPQLALGYVGQLFYQYRSGAVGSNAFLGVTTGEVSSDTNATESNVSMTGTFQLLATF